MAKSVIRYDLLISCPGDVTNEITLINKAVEEFNSLYSDVLGIVIQTRHWSKDSYPQSGGRPQALLNEQFVKSCDAAVAVFWTRFGTPTDKYGSGTEEEIEIMLAGGKQVFLYFSDKPVTPSQHKPEEYARVKAFQEKHKADILYGTYESDEEFYKKFFAHLSQHFLAEKRVSEIKEDRRSKLCLMGIGSDGKLTDKAVYQKYQPNIEGKVSGTVAEIKELFEEASGIHLSRGKSRDVSLAWSFKQPVTISEGWRKLIELMAEKLEIDLSEDFFYLGSLVKDTMQSNVLLGESVEGSKDEERKYELLKKLYRKIEELSDWLDVESGFADLMCVKLAISNEGTMVDEDIDVALRIPRKSLRMLDEMPQLNLNTMEYLTRKCDLTELLGISGTAEYGDYDSAQKPVSQSPTYRRHLDFPGSVDYEAEYKEDLENVFCHDVYVEGNECIIKLKFDYIKHHTTVSFPAAILLKDAVASIPYTITSKNSAEIIKGTLVMEVQ